MYFFIFIKKEKGQITGDFLSVKHQPLPIPSGGLEIPLILKFNFSKLITFNGEVKIEEKEYKEQILAMVIDEDQNSIYEKAAEDGSMKLATSRK